MQINKVAVIGSGVMGSGIAAHISNAGIEVVLMDIVPKDANDRNVLAKKAIEKMLKTDPAPFMLKSNARLITPANIEDDLNLLKECDWIIEVVIEDLDIKHQTYRKIADHKKESAIVSSNTSTIPLEKLVEPFDDHFKKNFLITHFFNPPRYLRLLELVVGEKTSPDVAKSIDEFCDKNLGKGVIYCHDTPGFIGNRIGVFWMTQGLNVAVEDNVPVEVADAVMSRPVGIPKTGIFGLLDLVGIDLMPHLAESLLSTLPKEDEYRNIYKEHNFVLQMIESGYIGRKGKGGFYRLVKNESGREKQSLKIDPNKFDDSQYSKSVKPKLDSVDAGKKGLRAVMEADDLGSSYAWKVLSRTLVYACSLVPEIADNISSVDEAMKLGYAWKKGPFEMIDDMGAEWFVSRLKDENVTIPPLLEKVGSGQFYKIEDGKRYYFGVDGKYHELIRPEGVLLLKDIKLSRSPVFKSASASLWDIDDGVLCVEFTGKMNTLDEDVFRVYEEAIRLITNDENDYKALVIYNEGSAFSAGANLGLALFAMNLGLWPQIESLISSGQEIYKALKFAPFPVIAAPSGLALGGGCEILLHVDHVQAHAETYTGLVEVGVGLIPGWGGCKEMVLRYLAEEQDNYFKATNGKTLWFSPSNSPMGAVRKAFETIGMAKVAKSAHEAKSLKIFRDDDGITMNRDRLLFDAKQRALQLSESYEAPLPREDLRLPGPSGKMALDLAVSDLRKSGKASPYDQVVCEHLATVLTGGENADWMDPMNEDDLLKLELDEFKKLVKNEGTMDRVEHMLNTGKPLRN